MTSGAGYQETAPPWFVINDGNFTGRRLYDWLGHHDLLVTNACPQLVRSASERGTPDAKWLQTNLLDIYTRWPFPLLLVCGGVARDTYDRKAWLLRCRVVEIPHPAARAWTGAALVTARRVIQEGTTSVRCTLKAGTLLTEEIPSAPAPGPTDRAQAARAAFYA